jgi:hypothetical protein
LFCMGPNMPLVIVQCCLLGDANCRTLINSHTHIYNVITNKKTTNSVITSSISHPLAHVKKV